MTHITLGRSKQRIKETYNKKTTERIEWAILILILRQFHSLLIVFVIQMNGLFDCNNSKIEDFCLDTKHLTCELFNLFPNNRNVFICYTSKWNEEQTR